MGKQQFASEIMLDGVPVGRNHPPYVVAELSGNHNGELKRALEIIDAAKAAGAHAIKIQTYTADTMTIDVDRDEFRILDQGSLWYGRSLYDLYQEAHTPWEWHKDIFRHCRAIGLTCFSTPFDFTAVKFLEDLGAPFYKIASFENTDLPLISSVAQTHKPLLVSTGMASVEEPGDICEVMGAQENDQLILLKCTSAYPANPKEIQLMTIADYPVRFGCQAGVSDHTLGIAVSVAAVGLGACLIEKHFTLKRSDGGVDAAFSLEPSELKELVDAVQCAWQARGEISYALTEGEKASVVFRRTLYFVRDAQKGSKITSELVRAIRPGHGLSPKYLSDVLNSELNRDVTRGTPVSWDCVKRKGC